MGTEEAYNLDPDPVEMAKLLRLLAKAIDDGKLTPQLKNLGGRLKRECKAKPGDTELVVHVDFSAYFVADADFVIGGIKLAQAFEAPGPEIRGASPVGSLPTS